MEPKGGVQRLIDAAEQAQRLVAGHTAAEVVADRMRRDSLLWNFTALGEAAGLVSDETKPRFPDVPWHTSSPTSGLQARSSVSRSGSCSP